MEFRTANNYTLTIMQYPSGKFGFVGSVPPELCEEKKNHIGQKHFASKVYETREAIEQAKLNYEPLKD